MNAAVATETEQRTNIGRMARVRVTFECYANVIDLVADSTQPKRVRIQNGGPMEIKGLVVQPHQYQLVGWADEEQD